MMNTSKDNSQKLWIFNGTAWAIILQSAAIIWWASTISAQTTANTKGISDIQSQMSTSYSVTLTREQLNDILASRDEQIKNLQKSLDDFKVEIRNSITKR